MLDRLWSESWRRADVLLAIALILFAIVVMAEANRLPPPFFDPLGSAAVPRFVAGLLILLAIALLGRCALTPVERRREGDGDGPKPTPWVAFGALAASVAYVGAMHAGLLGFAPASAAFVIALGAILARGKRTVIFWMVPLGLVVGFGLNALLTEVFYIDLPQRSFYSGAD